MARQGFSIPTPAMLVADEASAYKFLEGLRWGGIPQACPKCGGIGRCSFLAPKEDTTGRKTRTGAKSQRRVWFCGHCRKQFSVLTDTVFHGTKVPIRAWVMVMFEMCASENPISAREVSRTYEVTNETSWHMLHRLRGAMRMEPVAGLLAGAVQVDEPWIGANRRSAGHFRRYSEFVRAMLGISRDDAEQVRDATPATRKRGGRGQDGPTADLGEE